MQRIALATIFFAVLIATKISYASDETVEPPFSERAKYFLATEAGLAGLSVLSAYAPFAAGVMQGLIMVPYGVILTTPYESSKKSILPWINIALISSLAIYNLTVDNRSGFDGRVFIYNFATYNAAIALADVYDRKLESERKYAKITATIVPYGLKNMSLSFNVYF